VLRMAIAWIGFVNGQPACFIICVHLCLSVANLQFYPSPFHSRKRLISTLGLPKLSSKHSGKPVALR